MRAGFWKSIGRPLIGVILTGGATVGAGMLGADSLDQFKRLDSGTPDKIVLNQKTRSDAPLWTFVADNRTAIIGLLVCLSIIPSAWSAIRARRAQQTARIDMLKRYMTMLRTQAFAVDGVSAKVRISLFVLEERRFAAHARRSRAPRQATEAHVFRRAFTWCAERFTKRKILHCMHRTDGADPKHPWAVDGDAGFVVRAWREQVRCEVEELLDTTQRDTYLKESWSSEDIFANLSWPGAAMAAVPIVLRPGSDPVAVFLVEALGVKIAPDFLHWNATLVCMLEELT